MISIKNPHFILSAAGKDGFYKSTLPQFAVAGRSNVGKSSFINCFGNNSKLARVSGDPGRTRLINYFDFGPFILTDLPGYGYAKAPKDESKNWDALINDYFTTENNLAGAIMLVDIRHAPSVLDVALAAYFYKNNIPFIIVATKSDKLSRAAIGRQIPVIASTLKVGKDNIIAASSQTGQGRNEILKAIEGLMLSHIAQKKAERAEAKNSDIAAE